MNSKFLSVLLLSVSLSAAPAGKDEAPAKKPNLRVDTSPLTDGKSTVVSSYADMLEPVQKTVVSIYSTKIVKQRAANPLLRQFFGDAAPDQERDSKQEGLGSGVIISADGYILTNNHVVEGADELKISLTDDREFIAKIIGADPKTDVAVIKIDADKLPFITLADSDNLRVGDVVFAVGNPLGVGQTVTMGIVSAKGRNQLRLLENVAGYENFIQTDAAINMGNSGGALVDAKGRLVGINSAIISPSRGNIGIGFAIPVNFAASVMNSLVETGTVTRGYLGVTTETVTADVAEQFGLPKDAKGVAITDVTPDGPAEKAGLQRTDVILAINDKPVTTLEGLRLVIAQMLPNSKVKIKLMRDSTERTLEVTLGRLAEKPNELLVGVNVTKLTEEVRKRSGLEARVTGLLITDIEENSPYGDRLVAGMVVIEINRTPVSDLVAAKLALVQGRNLLLVNYRGAYRFVAVTVK
ncbi:MAG: Do family serine endopeptidase [Undibacterium sp.]|nr:Do family serine endopeptidase [Opitutaceae bacterium]